MKIEVPFNIKKKSEYLDIIRDSLKSFINKHQNLIDSGEWQELFSVADKECLSWYDQSVLIHILHNAGLVEKE